MQEILIMRAGAPVVRSLRSCCQNVGRLLRLWLIVKEGGARMIGRGITVGNSMRMGCFALIVLAGLVYWPGGNDSPADPAMTSEAAMITSSRVPVSGSLSSAHFRIDTSHSRFTVRAFASGLLSFAAHNHTIAIRDFGGDADATYGTVEPASLNMRVKAASLAVTDKVSDSDRQKIETTMRNEVLETSKYPDIVFQSTKVSATRLDEGKYQIRIFGNLTLHGTTRPVTLNARVDFGENEFHAVGEFPVKQSEFGIKPVSVAGGTIKVKDEVKLAFDIVARKS